MKSPKVSIIVPIYNVSSFIEKCIVSLMEQTFEEIEYVFVNDATKDNSIEILNSVVNRYAYRKECIKIIEHNINQGLAVSRNTGINNSKGEFILHIDSDDYIDTEMVKTMYDKAIEDSADIVVCDFCFEWKSKVKISSQQTSNNKNEYLRLLLEAKTLPGVVNKLFKRSLYIDNNIKAIPGINLGEDFLTTPRLVYFAKNISKVDLPLYHYIQYNNNSHTSILDKRYIDNLYNVYQHLEKFLINKNELDNFKDSLELGKFKKKIEILERCAFTEKAYVDSMFVINTMIIKKFNLSLKEKLFLFFERSHSELLFRLYIIFYKRFFSILQKIKGRK